MAVSIRPADAADAESMRQLMPRLAAFALPARRDPHHLWMHDLELLEQWLGGEQPGCRIQVAVDEDAKVCGIAMVSLRPELLSREPSAHLEALAVADGYEGKGVGARLLEAAEEDARQQGAKSLTLHVFAVNARARRLYEKAGFEGELMRYIKDLDGAGSA